MNVNDTVSNKEIANDNQKGIKITQIDLDDDIYLIEECDIEKSIKDNLSKSQLKELKNFYKMNNLECVKNRMQEILIECFEFED